MTSAQKAILATAAGLILAGLFLRLRIKAGNLSRQEYRAAACKGKRKRFLVLFAAAVLLLGCGTSVFETRTLSPAFSIHFNFEAASRGLNPDETRLNAEDVLNEDVLNAVISDAGLNLTPEELRNCFSIRSSYDQTAVSTTDPKIATVYQVTLTRDCRKYGLNANALIDTVAEEARRDYLNKHVDHARILDIELSGVDGMDYSDADDYIQMQANRIKNYLNGYQWTEQTYTDENGQTFSSLAGKVTDFINTPLAQYSAYIRENGLTRQNSSFLSVTDYQNRTMRVNYDKKMAYYNARLAAIEMYDSCMANVVLVPTDDKSGEFYMSRTKIGVDYFASDANDALNEAAKIKQKIDDNTAASEHIESPDETAAAKADTMLSGLKEQLTELSKDAKALYTGYLNEKIENSVTVDIYHPGPASLLSIKRNLCVTLFCLASAVFFLAESDRFKAVKKGAAV